MELPTNIEAEEAILGGLLIDPSAIARIADGVQPEFFAIHAHQIVWRAAIALHQQGKPTDLMTVATHLADRSQLESVGGQTKLAQLVERTVSAVNIDQYVALIEDKYLRRRLISTGIEIAELGQQTWQKLPEVFEAASSKLFDICQKTTEHNARPIADGISKVFANLEAEECPSIKTGLIDLDNLIGGLRKQELIVVAGRPSMGKSWLANYFAHHVADHHKLPVVFFSAEMSETLLVSRFLASQSGIDVQEIIDHKIRQKDAQALIEAMRMLTELAIIIDDSSGTTLNPNYMRSVLRRAVAEYGDLGLIILDYIQLLGQRDAGNRAQVVGAIAGECKAIAKEFDCPFVALAQLNRELNSRNDKRPAMSDLKDSGDIEQDMDVGIFLHREDYYNPDSPDKGLVELLVRKNRNGATGTAKAIFEPATGRFKNALLRRHHDQSS